VSISLISVICYGHLFTVYFVFVVEVDKLMELSDFFYRFFIFGRLITVLVTIILLLFVCGGAITKVAKLELSLYGYISWLTASKCW